MKRQRKEIPLPNHSHCVICGTVTPVNEMFCSDKCREENEKMVKRQKNLRFAAFLPIIIVTIFIIVLFLLRGT